MSQILPLSFNISLPFLTSIELHQEMTTSLTAVIKWMSNHEATNELFIIAYACSDWLTAPFLTIASIQTVQLLSSWNSESLKIAFTNTLLCYFVSCDEFCQVQYNIVIESVTVLSWTCCFSVPGYLYNHGVCFLPLLYSCDNHFTSIIVHSQACSLHQVQTVCSQ